MRELEPRDDLFVCSRFPRHVACASRDVLDVEEHFEDLELSRLLRRSRNNGKKMQKVGRRASSGCDLFGRDIKLV